MSEEVKACGGPPIWHALGKRDAAAEILMLVRTMGPNEALREVAKQLLAVIPDHPHAKWVLENVNG
jgi:hypothetical protein